MVGAGFSRNAIPVSASAREFPLWFQVAKNLCSKLYPPSDKNRLEQALSEASGTSGFLRLAQEYEIAFGRGSLHNFINNSVPDSDYKPSELHHQLLELPWKEVLTTNWDTLLERTLIEIPERSYNIVRTVDELANTPSPRIIKLHGTVPAHIPFIFTEEDYRTYPKKFAPFVNTVQQIMMESAVLLLGFSGDDPNFLQWSGWVRDNLGVSSPKIYLAGWLGLSPHRRRMLENNNIVPIDLASHPKAKEWPEHLRHQYATEWIIRTLQCGQAYEYKDWPSTDNYEPPSIAEYLIPLELNSQIIPLPITRRVKISPAPIETLKEILDIWEHNRKIYPNWLIFPLNNHFFLDNQYNEWINIFIERINEFNIEEQLKFLREVFWFYKTKLVPVPNDIEDLWSKLSEKYNFNDKTIDSKNYTQTWSYLKEIFIENSLISLTYNRLKLNTQGFSKRLKQIQAFSNHSIEVKNSIIYEQCQWFILNLDFSELEKLLNVWDVGSSDSIWMYRKSSLLLELNLEYEADSLMLKAFSIIKNNPDKFNDFSNSSREGWALLSIRALNHGISTEEIKNKIRKFNIDERYKKLALTNCDANSQLQYLIEKTNKRPDKNKKDENPHFDLYHARGRVFYFNNYRDESIANTYKCLMLCETAGLALQTKNFSIGSPLINALVDNYDLVDIELVMRIMLRLKPSDDDKSLNTIYSRTFIANLDYNKVIFLTSQINTLLGFCLSKITKASDNFWINYIRICLEILSRLIIRLISHETLKIHLEQSIELFKNHKLRQFFLLHQPLSNYLKRSWETSDKTLRKEYIWKILELPINDINNKRANRLLTIEDLISDVDLDLLVTRQVENESEWSKIIDLIISGLKLSGNPRWDASIRVQVVSKFITKDEADIINRLLWGESSNDFSLLPKDTNLYDFAYVLSPLGMSEKANELFLKKYFIESENFDFLTKSIEEISQAVKYIKISTIDRDTLLKNISNWLNIIPEEKISSNKSHGVFYDISNTIIKFFSCLAEIVVYIDIPQQTAEILFNKMNYLLSHNIYTYHVVGILSKSIPNKIDEIHTFLRKGIISDIPENNEHAMFGLFIWLKQSLKYKVSQLNTPSDDLVREIGLSIATRKQTNLIQALLSSIIIFKYGEKATQDIISSLVLEGLEYLILEECYSVAHNRPEFVPIIRLNCIRLAHLMSINGYKNELIILKWLNEANNDPLPEVRNALQKFDF